MIRFGVLVLVLALGACGRGVPAPGYMCKEYSTTEQTCYARGGGCYPACKRYEYVCADPLVLDSTVDGVLFCRLNKPK